MEHSEEIKELAAAMVKAQSEIVGATKDATNPHFGKQYADLSSVMEACKGALNRNGIAILQAPAPAEKGTLAIDTVLMHQSGQWCSGRTEIPLQKVDPQGFGSAMTYARRYSLAAMVGVCPEDDDGEGAMDRGSNGNARRQPTTNSPRPSVKPVATNKATPDQVREMKELLTQVKLPDGTTAKWLDKAGVDRFEDMSADALAKCIEYTRKRMPAPVAA